MCLIAAKKKGNKKGKTFSLTDFLSEDSGGGGGGGGERGGNAPPPNYPAKSTSWADETDDLDGDGAHTHAHSSPSKYLLKDDMMMRKVWS